MFELDFLKVRRLANQQVIAANQTRWYSPLSFMNISMRQTPSPDLPTVPEDEYKTPLGSNTTLVSNDTEAYTEQVGTIVINSREVGRRALRPQPSLDPNDPLNWSSWQKYSTYLTVCFFTFLATANASKFTVAVIPLSKEFKKSNFEIGYLVCFNILFLGVGNIFWVPLMRIIGKRPVFLISLPILAVTNVWAARTHNFNSLLASQIASGFAGAAAEASVPAVAADLFFVHQRGTVLMMFHMALSFGAFLGPLINSYVVPCGATWIVSIFIVHESSYYKRDVNAPFDSYPSKKTFIQKLSLTNGYNKDTSFLQALWNTIRVLAYPPVLWTGLTVGVFVGWGITVQLTSSRTFVQPPYNYKASFLGFICISGFIGTLIALFFGGKLIDVISNRVTKAHYGVREPEYRLYAFIIPAIVGPMGILLFGLTISEHRPWLEPAVGYAMDAFGLIAVNNVLVTYAVDSYLPLAGEVLVVTFVMRGVIGTVLALYSVKWMENVGQKNFFGMMVGVEYFMCAWVILFLIYGKRIRARTARYGPMV
ncbi:putative MFS-type transporter [Lachnellula suecica]|uniref:Putative MFS-type transporter n=1 Tax=Lachnellula suecica TaxID=602035 RepID=A0A8T9C133_9HELO|nr:putative MFS-type transporter [Lachnellula suecica]